MSIEPANFTSQNNYSSNFSSINNSSMGSINSGTSCPTSTGGSKTLGTTESASPSQTSQIDSVNLSSQSAQSNGSGNFASRTVNNLLSGIADWMNPGSGNAVPGSGNAVPGSGNAVPGSGNAVPGSGNAVPGSGNAVPGSGNAVPGSGNAVPGSGNAVPGSGNAVPGSGNAVPGSGNAVPGSGNAVPGSGNAVPGSGNAVPGSGNAVPGSGNAVPGSGNAVPGSGNAVPGSGNAVPGSGNAVPGSGNAVPDSGNAVPGSGNAVPGSGNAVPGSGNAVPGSGNAQTGTENSGKFEDPFKKLNEQYLKITDMGDAGKRQEALNDFLGGLSSEHRNIYQNSYNNIRVLGSSPSQNGSASSGNAVPGSGNAIPGSGNSNYNSYQPRETQGATSPSFGSQGTPRTESRTEPTESRTEPTESRTEPSESRTEPTESRTEPTESRTEPTESRTEPTESRTEPTESRTEPSESRTEPTESRTEPTESRTEPSESRTEPTESRTEPSQSTTEANPEPSETEAQPSEESNTESTESGPTENPAAASETQQNPGAPQNPLDMEIDGKKIRDMEGSNGLQGYDNVIKAKYGEDAFMVDMKGQENNADGRMDAGDMIAYKNPETGEMTTKPVGNEMRDIQFRTSAVNAANTFNDKMYNKSTNPDGVLSFQGNMAKQKYNTEFWKQNKVDGKPTTWQVKDGVKTSDAINDIFDKDSKGKYSLDCAASINLILLKAKMDTMGEGDFNKKFEDMQISGWNNSQSNDGDADQGYNQRFDNTGAIDTLSGDRTKPGSVENLQPGDMAYFNDMSNTNYENNARQGENSLYLGMKDGKAQFFGNPIGIESLDPNKPEVIYGKLSEMKGTPNTEYLGWEDRHNPETSYQPPAA